MAGVKLKRLTIHEYPNVAPGTELVFNDTWNVLLGRNGTGKTTLLKLIAMVVRHDFSDLKETEFSIEYDLALAGGEVHISLQNRSSESASPSSPRLPARAAWSYKLDLSTGGKVYSFVSDPFASTYDTKDKRRPQKRIHHLNPFDSISYGHIWAFYLEGVGALEKLSVETADLGRLSESGRFDEALDAFSLLCGTEGSRLYEGPLSPIIITLRLDDGSTSPIYRWFFPAKLMSVLSRWQGDALTAASLRLPDRDAAFLRTAVKLLGFEAGEMILSLENKEATGRSESFRYGHPSFLFTLPGGSQITQAALSFGQKRLLAFLYYVACNDDIIIADELVNGMHYDWIEACIEAIGDRQSFLTSQNPLLLDFLPFASAAEVQKSFIQCERLAPSEGQGRAQLAWHNLSGEDAASFFRAYEVGVQHVSEILRTKGMW